MMAPGTREFLQLLQAVEAGGLTRVLYFLSHPNAIRVALASRQNPTSHLDISYWSTTPYLFGAGRAVKYIARPRSAPPRTLPQPLTDTYLRDALASRLETADASFDFMIQFQTDSRTMPIEDASVEWKEQESPYHPVARIRIPRQTHRRRRIDAAACEQVAFNPWNCLIEHRPLGELQSRPAGHLPRHGEFRDERVKASSGTR